MQRVRTAAIQADEGVWLRFVRELSYSPFLYAPLPYQPNGVW
jgi:hypothetical protein